MEEELRLSKYPEGWERAKSLLKNVPDDEKDSYLFGYMMMILTN